MIRRHSPESAALALSCVREMFPAVGPIEFVAQDWTGRQYAIDGGLVLFDPATAEANVYPYASVDEAVAEDPSFFLMPEFHAEWQAMHPDPVPDNSCVGYQIPLFIGGPDAVENLVVISTRVYWSVTGQMWQQVKDLPPGTPIGEFRVVE
ncbi:DUF1851 domain-containing protein [Lentzea alba]|uniref:hypothetical protein n=1 Tax=Lentzea alba TaxID=2714351 RepID=UPI0039BF4005